MIKHQHIAEAEVECILCRDTMSWKVWSSLHLYSMQQRVYFKKLYTFPELIYLLL